MSLDKDSSAYAETQIAGKSVSQAGEHASIWTDLTSNLLNLNPLKNTALIPVQDSDSPDIKYNENVRNVNLDLSSNRNYVEEFLDWRVDNHAGWKFWLYQAPLYKFPLDMLACSLAFRSVRRAYYIYEVGLGAIIGTGFVASLTSFSIRNGQIGQKLKTGELKCTECAVTRGVLTDLLLVPFTYTFAITLSFIQAERYKSAEMPSGSRMSLTKAQRSTLNGIYKQASSRGGGLRGALFLSLVPGIIMNFGQAQAMKDFWGSMNTEEYRGAVIRQKKYLVRQKTKQL